MSQALKITILGLAIVAVPLVLAAVTSGTLQLALVAISIPLIAAFGVPLVFIRHIGHRRASALQTQQHLF